MDAGHLEMVRAARVMRVSDLTDFLVWPPPGLGLDHPKAPCKSDWICAVEALQTAQLSALRHEAVEWPEPNPGSGIPFALAADCISRAGSDWCSKPGGQDRLVAPSCSLQQGGQYVLPLTEMMSP